MNELKQQPPKQLSAIEQEIENVNFQLSRIEKTLSACVENFNRFDAHANKINPDDFFKNQPRCEGEGIDSRNQNQAIDPSPYNRSGLILKLNELGAFAKQLEERFTDFNENNIVQTLYFFDRNV